MIRFFAEAIDFKSELPKLLHGYKISGFLQLKNLTTVLQKCPATIAAACNTSAQPQPNATVVAGKRKQQQIKQNKTFIVAYHH